MTTFYVVGTYWGIVSFVKFYFLANVINAFVVFIAWECYWNSNYLNW